MRELEGRGLEGLELEGAELELESELELVGVLSNFSPVPPSFGSKKGRKLIPLEREEDGRLICGMVPLRSWPKGFLILLPPLNALTPGVYCPSSAATKV